MVLLVGMTSSCLAFDMRGDAIKALDEAKKVGLPTKPTDLIYPKPSAEAMKIEALISKADKTVRGNQPTLSQVLAKSEQISRGAPREAAIKPETPTEKAARRKRLLAILDQLGATKGPRAPGNMIATLSFQASSLIKGLVSTKLDDASASIQTGNGGEVVKKLRVARRLVELIPTDSTFGSCLAQQDSEMEYYRFLQRTAVRKPAIAKLFTKELVAPMRRPSVEQVLREEYFHTLSLFMDTRPSPGASSGWALPKDVDNLRYLTTDARAWATAFPQLKTAKTGQELETRYKAFGGKLGTFRLQTGDAVPLGPAWANLGRALDRGETKRLETMAMLGLAK